MNAHSQIRKPIGLTSEETASVKREIAKTIADIHMLAHRAHSLSALVGITAPQNDTLVKAEICLSEITQSWRKEWA